VGVDGWMGLVSSWIEEGNISVAGLHAFRTPAWLTATSLRSCEPLVCSNRSLRSSRLIRVAEYAT